MCVSWTRRSPAHPSRAPDGRVAGADSISKCSFALRVRAGRFPWIPAAAKPGTQRAEGCYPRLWSCNNARAAMRPGVPTTPPEGFVPAPDT